MRCKTASLTHTARVPLPPLLENMHRFPVDIISHIYFNVLMNTYLSIIFCCLRSFIPINLSRFKHLSVRFPRVSANAAAISLCQRLFRNINGYRENKTLLVLQVFLIFTFSDPWLLCAQIIKFCPESSRASCQGLDLLRNVCWHKLKDGSPQIRFRKAQVARFDTRCLHRHKLLRDRNDRAGRRHRVRGFSQLPQSGGRPVQPGGSRRAATRPTGTIIIIINNNNKLKCHTHRFTVSICWERHTHLLLLFTALKHGRTV